MVVGVQQHHGEEWFAVARWPSEWYTGDDSLLDTFWLSFVDNLKLTIPGIVMEKWADLDVRVEDVSVKQNCASSLMRSYVWARCSLTRTLLRKCICVLRIFFKADANHRIKHIEIGKSVRPIIDRDVTSRSIDLSISTSLIQCIVIWGFACS